MQDLNDDMDELFRRAANDYPLYTNSPDWNKVSGLLNALENTEAKVSFRRQNKYPTLLLLLLLQLLPVTINDYTFINSMMVLKDSVKANAQFIHIRALDNHLNTVSESRNDMASSLIKIKTSNKNYSAKTNKNLLYYNNEIFYRSELSTLISDKNLKNKKVFLFSNNRLKKSEELIAIKSRPTHKNSIEEKNGNIDISTLLDNYKRDFKNDFETADGKEITEKKEKTIVKKKNKHVLYAGFLVGPDISTVKFQSVNKTGFSAGLLAGYALSKKLTVETGVIWNKKFYYSDGKYFNPKKNLIPSFLNIDDVEGNCNMIEWPVNLSYTIKSFKKHFLTANAGLSSYFMKRENYSYTFQRNGISNEWHLSYKNSSHNLFSVLNIGASYNQHITKSLLFRIQPYIKIPVGGIGMGRLPITSSGVYFMLTKRLR